MLVVTGEPRMSGESGGGRRVGTDSDMPEDEDQDDLEKKIKFR